MLVQLPRLPISSDLNGGKIFPSEQELGKQCLLNKLLNTTVRINKFSQINCRSWYYLNADCIKSWLYFAGSLQLGIASKFCSKIRILTFQKNGFYLFQWKPFKNDEKSFLFYIKSSFRSQDIYIFVLTFWLCGKTAW